MFLAVRAVWSRQLSIFWNSLHCLWKGVLFGPDNGNIDFKISEFWLYRANSERKLLAFRTTTTVLLHKLASFLPVLHSQRSIQLIQSMLLTPFISFSLTRKKNWKDLADKVMSSSIRSVSGWIIHFVVHPNNRALFMNLHLLSESIWKLMVHSSSVAMGSHHGRESWPPLMQRVTNWNDTNYSDSLSANLEPGSGQGSNGLLFMSHVWSRCYHSKGSCCGHCSCFGLYPIPPGDHKEGTSKAYLHPHIKSLLLSLGLCYLSTALDMVC